jgi:hypothetical protein
MDPFDVAHVMKAGTNVGRKVATDTRRSVVMIDEARLGEFGLVPEKDTLVFANFGHNKGFWIARIHKSQIRRVSFLLETFSTIPFKVRPQHSSLLFEMEPESALNLTAQQRPPRIDEMPPRRVSEFTFTIEGVQPEGETWNLLDAGRGRYVAAGQFYSLEHHVSLSVSSERQPGIRRQRFHMLPLNLDKNGVWALLGEAVRWSASLEGKEPFSVVTNSCHQKLIRLLDRVVPHAPVQETVWTRVGRNIPPAARWVLDPWGIVNRDERWTNLLRTPMAGLVREQRRLLWRGAKPSDYATEAEASD